MIGQINGGIPADHHRAMLVLPRAMRRIKACNGRLSRSSSHRWVAGMALGSLNRAVHCFGGGALLFSTDRCQASTKQHYYHDHRGSSKTAGGQCFVWLCDDDCPRRRWPGKGYCLPESVPRGLFLFSAENGRNGCRLSKRSDLSSKL